MYAGIEREKAKMKEKKREARRTCVRMRVATTDGAGCGNAAIQKVEEQKLFYDGPFCPSNIYSFIKVCAV